MKLRETKYGVEPTEDLLTHGMRNGFENMCEVYDTSTELVHVFIYVVIYIILSINVDILITFYFYACRWNMKIWNKIKSMNKAFQITQEEYPLKMSQRWDIEASRQTTTLQAMIDDQYI